MDIFVQSGGCFGRRENLGQRVAILVDNLVVLEAAATGRSTSRRLNCILHGLSACLLCSVLHRCFVHVTGEKIQRMNPHGGTGP